MNNITNLTAVEELTVYTPMQVNFAQASGDQANCVQVNFALVDGGAREDAAQAGDAQLGRAPEADAQAGGALTNGGSGVCGDGLKASVSRAELFGKGACKDWYQCIGNEVFPLMQRR